MSERMLTANELAVRFGVSVYTIHRMAHKENGLKGYKIGNRTRFKPSDVEEYLSAHEVKVPDKPKAFAHQHFAYKPGMKVVSL